jgi:Icc protein
LLRLVWTTDLHLDHAPQNLQERWLSSIANHTFDGLLIGGDISEGGKTTSWLREIAQRVKKPIYFVLGNHDFYDDSIRLVRQKIIRMCREYQNLHYLTDCSAVRLGVATDSESNPTYLIGEDAWGDATTGDFDQSFVQLNDFSRIGDFLSLKPEQQKLELQRLGLQSAQRLASKLSAIHENMARIVVLTHVPPFVESCWYEGKTADRHWSPFFVCGQTGEVLKSHATNHPNHEIVVLCGHCHHSGITQLTQNLIIYTGEASIGHPAIAGIMNIGERSISLNQSELL